MTTRNRRELPDVPKKMKAAIMHQPMSIAIEEVAVPEVGPDEVLVKVKAVGICGSDIHFYEHGRIGRFIVNGPFILGHECAGVAVALGERVERIKLGDRVAVEPGATCGKCDACKSGRYNLCPDVQFLAAPPVNGAFAQYITMREDLLFPIPDHLSFEEASLNEPLSVGIHAAKRAGLNPGSKVAIMGMGPVGLMTVVAAKAFGASEIYVTDLEQNRLDAAIGLGATHAINIREQDPVETISQLTSGKGVDVAFETAGNPKALQSALASLGRGGKLSIVGLPMQDEIPLNIPFIADREIDIFGIFRYVNTYPQGIAFLSSGISPVKNIITDRYMLDQTYEAMERARTNKSGSLKVMVYPNGY